MATDPGTPAAPTAPKKRGTFWRIARLILIGAVASIALLLVFPPTGLIKDQLARSIGAAIGRTVTIGDMRLKLRPALEAAFDQVAVSNPPGMPARGVFRAESIHTTVELLPLLKGRVRMNRLDLIKPVFALEEGADGTRNWVFGAARPQAETPPAADPARSEPEGTAPPPASEALRPAAFSYPPDSAIVDGTLTFRSARTGAERTATAINAVQTFDPVSGALASKGHLAAGGETVAFDAAVGDLEAVIGGTSSPLKAHIDARPLRASVDGEASFSAAAEFTGALTASSASLIDLARWLGSDVTASGSPLRGSLDGTIRTTTRDITFTETDVMIDTTSGRFEGILDLGGVRPRLTGALASEHIDLGRATGAPRQSALAPTPETDFAPLVTPGWEQLLNDLNALERGPASAAAEAAPSTAAPAITSPGWSEQPFNLKALKALDLDLLVTAAAVTYGALDLKQARVKAGLAEGMLDARLEALEVGRGTATGTLTIDSRAAPPRANVQLSMADVAAEPIVTELTGKPLLSGTSQIEITASAAGQTQSQLTSTLDGKAHFRMGPGALRGFDVRRMIFEWWKSWSFDLAAKTGFTRLEAQYDIKKGIMRSEPGLAMGGSEVEINSAGTVNVPQKKLDQEIRVKAIPPPTAFPIPIKISGGWAKPSIGIDWGGLFSAAPGLGGPQALAEPPEPPPANVEAAIRRVLAQDLPDERLSPEARRMLEGLLPAEPSP
jgi:AsmA protein